VENEAIDVNMNVQTFIVHKRKRLWILLFLL